MDWTNIFIDHAAAIFNKWDKLLSFNCNWCNSIAGDYTVTRTSALTGNSYTDYACKHCAEEWAKGTPSGTLDGALAESLARLISQEQEFPV